MILQFAILLGFLVLGELTVWLTGIPIPASILGMIYLAAALATGVVKESWIDRVSDFLIRNLGFFFIPAGVGVMECFGLIADQWVAIVGASVISTFLIIVATGHTHQGVRRLLKSRDNGVSSK